MNKKEDIINLMNELKSKNDEFSYIELIQICFILARNNCS